MPQTFVALYYHLIFSTQNREPTLADDLRPRLYEYIGGYLRAENSRLIAAGGMPDHVHLLVSLYKQISITDAVKGIKANSSKWIHENFDHLKGFAWQAGYGAFSVTYSNTPAIKSYLAQQDEHHRVSSFQEEFLAFLKRHEMAYDERYIWD